MYRAKRLFLQSVVSRSLRENHASFLEAGEKNQARFRTGLTASRSAPRWRTVTAVRRSRRPGSQGGSRSMRWWATRNDPTGNDPTGNDRGAAALEFALVLPVLLIVVFGLIDFGRMLNAQLIASDAAREGARAAAIVDAHEGEVRIDSITASTIGAVTRTVTGC